MNPTPNIGHIATKHKASSQPFEAPTAIPATNIEKQKIIIPNFSPIAL